VENYPDSYNAYHCLAEAYAVKGEKSLAIKNYEKSIAPNPNNRRAIEDLQKSKIR